MGTVSTTLPSDGQTIDSSDVNTPINAILSEFNGNIDDNNIKTGANINGAKLLAGSLPGTSFDTTLASGWLDLADTPDTVTNNGNRSYDLVFNSTDLTDTVSEGMRLRTTRTVSAPTQCADLESGSSQYFSSASAGLAGMTFTDDFTCSAWIKLESYSTDAPIISRINGTQGWWFGCNSSGQIILSGHNAALANYRRVVSYQSIPLNKWVHVTAQLDMSTYTATTTTCYVMIDGVDVPVSLAQNGTNPTALVQAGDLNVGTGNAGVSFGLLDGKIAQVAIYSAKVTQATIKASMSQTLSGSETSLVSAFSCSNSLLDLNTTNNNDLTANGGALMTNADSPFGNYLGGTLDYAIITKTAFSTNTTLTVQVPEGCTIPTSGGVSAVAYSTQKTPYRFPVSKGRWIVEMLNKTTVSQAAAVEATYYNLGSQQLSIPIGEWVASYKVAAKHSSVAGNRALTTSLSTSASSVSNDKFLAYSEGNSTAALGDTFFVESHISLSATTLYYLISSAIAVSTSTLSNVGASATTVISAECAYL